MKATRHAFILATLAALVLPLSAAEKPATPLAAFEAMKQAVAAKDAAAFQSLMLAKKENGEKLMKQFAVMPEDARRANGNARFIEVKIAGEYACAIILAQMETTVNAEGLARAKFSDQYFVKRDGGWLLCMGPVTDAMIPDAQRRAFYEWYQERIAKPAELLKQSTR